MLHDLVFVSTLFSLWIQVKSTYLALQWIAYLSVKLLLSLSKQVSVNVVKHLYSRRSLPNKKYPSTSYTCAPPDPFWNKRKNRNTSLSRVNLLLPHPFFLSTKTHFNTRCKQGLCNPHTQMKDEVGGGWKLCSLIITPFPWNSSKEKLGTKS